MLATSAGCRGAGGVDLIELEVVLGPAHRIAKLVERGIDPHHPLRRPLPRDVRVEPSRERAVGIQDHVIVHARLDAKHGVRIVRSLCHRWSFRVPEVGVTTGPHTRRSRL